MKLTYPNSRRMPELDALRGLFLVWMTFAHMPTRFSDFVNQPFGFVTSAEGFVFMSALLVSRVYLRDAQQNETGLRANDTRFLLRPDSDFFRFFGNPSGKTATTTPAKP